MASARELTQVLQAVERGESQAASELLPLVYDELRQLAGFELARLKPGQTLQATALVHEAWLKVVGDSDPSWDCRAHFFGAAARAMRNILVDRARHHAVRRQVARVAKDSIDDEWAFDTPSDEILAVHDALEKLEQKNARMARVVVLRFFGGLTMKEIGRVTGDSQRSTEELWALARAWLKRRVEGASG